MKDALFKLANRSLQLKTKKGLKSPLEAKIQTTDPIGFFYEQKGPFDENLVYLAQKLSKPLFFMSSDFEIGVPFLINHSNQVIQSC